MTAREAKRIAYRIAYRAVDTVRNAEGLEGVTPQDQDRIDRALDEIAQMLFERSDSVERKQR